MHCQEARFVGPLHVLKGFLRLCFIYFETTWQFGGAKLGIGGG